MFSYSSLRASQRLCQSCRRSFSISAIVRNEAKPTQPPMMGKIRADLKAAMQAKDTPRLSVLRAIMSATLNASKTSSPIATDAQLLALIRKNANSARDAAAEFRAAGREDLAQKEETQAAVLKEYTDSLQGDLLSETEIREIVNRVVETIKQEAQGVEAKLGDVMKRVLGPDGVGEKSVEKSTVAKIVKEIVGGK